MSPAAVPLTEKLGFILTEHRPDEDIAYVLDTDGNTILLAGPKAQDIPSYLSAQHHIAQLGQILSAYSSDLEAREALHCRGKRARVHI